MIESLFTWSSVRSKQLGAPLLKERGQYLSHLLSQEVSTARVKTVASMMLHIIRLLDLDSPRIVREEEIQQAASRWIVDVDSHVTRKVGPNSAATFIFLATKWLRSVNLIYVPILPVQPTDTLLDGFVGYMNQTGIYPRTIQNYRRRARPFLHWALSRHEQLSSISLIDIEDFFSLKRGEGWLPRSIASLCSALKAFFRYTSLRGWNSPHIYRGIKAPRISRYSHSREILPWKQVRLLLSAEASEPADLRASAILFLCSIYGLRSSEVVNLTLDDFDWINETFFVRRAKRGRIQQYPIQVEVGDSILKYLQNGRPRSSCRKLFLTLQPPYRAVNPATFWTIIMKRIRRFGLPLRPFGPHALRRACATELLRKGSSLQDIADFLGHRNLQCVSIYAKHDTKSLKKVASFSLDGLK
jgi:integrase/recombinase XerD